jgi:transcriptional regulator with XRE-family HTH domain
MSYWMTPRTSAAKIGLRIHKLRQERGWTQERLCLRSGLCVQTICRLERGRRAPALRTLDKLAKALGTSIDYLLKGKTA